MLRVDSVIVAWSRFLIPRGSSCYLLAVDKLRVTTIRQYATLDAHKFVPGRKRHGPVPKPYENVISKYFRLNSRSSSSSLKSISS